MSANLKLPRDVEADPRREAVEKLLSQDMRPLWENGTIKVSYVKATPGLEKALNEAKRDGTLERGLEQIESKLRSEKKGLAVLQEKQNREPALRVSRLLLVPDECAERFYRNCEAILFNHSDRLLVLRVNVPYTAFAEKLYGEGALVKALLVSDKKAVARVLFALAGNEHAGL